MELVTTFQLCNCSSPTVILTISRQKEHRGSGPAHNMLGVVAACYFCWSWWGYCCLSAAVRVMWAAHPADAPLGLQHPHPQAPRQSKSRTQEALWHSVALGLRVCDGFNYAKKTFSIKEKWKKLLYLLQELLRIMIPTTTTTTTNSFTAKRALKFWERNVLVKETKIWHPNWEKNAMAIMQ